MKMEVVVMDKEYRDRMQQEERPIERNIYI